MEIIIFSQSFEYWGNGDDVCLLLRERCHACEYTQTDEGKDNPCHNIFVAEKDFYELAHCCLSLAVFLPYEYDITSFLGIGQYGFIPKFFVYQNASTRDTNLTKETNKSSADPE